ncbi:uncharacterized protein LOC129956479 [Argiope bruennichi]|uniref:uncharacterized protein LOC129956479 n=1 Tax=Argiope bruennichi TaxID=94029 RepID=UPI002494255E|nr:uncharacterized protein LOC129956479 [Argiope bruennichi]XP_055924356.1 uncharacterized protein LOC129956479 [Argiope bruennichi]
MAPSLISRPGRGLNLPNTKNVLEQSASEEKGNHLIKSTFDLLERGEKEIRFDDKHKDVILILGNTGSGKSTFTQWVAGDNSKMISKETKEGTGEYIIEDHNRIGDTTLKSKTIFPELVIDDKTNAVYYDCPGFSDTQGTSHDIATTYFIKKVVDYSESVKMVFTISHPSVRKGVDRQDFMKLLRHVTDLVKDIEKFKHSIAIVATKVDNQYVKQGKNFILVEDGLMIAAIADFLQEAKQYLQDSSKRPNLSEKNNRFYENAIKFVDILLEKEGEHYTKIGIFRRPDEPGPVSDIPLLQNGKQSIERIVYEKLSFTAKSNEDFGYTVSEKTKNDINELVEEINKNLWSSFSNIARNIQDSYRNTVQQIRCQIHLFVSASGVTGADSSDAKAFRDKLNNGYNIALDLVIKTKNLMNPGQVAELVNNAISNLGIDIPKDEVLYIANQGKYFNFLQTVSDNILSSKPWNQLFKEVESFLSGSKTILLRDADLAAEKINIRMQISLNDTIKSIQEQYVEKIKLLEIQKLPEILNRDRNTIAELTEEIMNGTTIEKLLNTVDDIANNLKVSVPKEYLQNITFQGKYLKFLEIISDETLADESIGWLSPFQSIAKYFYESERWYIFLEDLYKKLSEYDIQKDRQRYNVANIEDWGQPLKPQGIFIAPNTFEKFLSKIRDYNVTGYETIKNLTIATTDLCIEEINQVLSLTLKHRPTVRCSEPHIIVKGSFVSLNETMQNIMSNFDTDNRCNNFKVQFASGKYNLFKIFALNKVFIDADLSFADKGTSVAVMAPDWEIIGSRSIELNGADGTLHAESKAKNGANPIKDGANGSPGKPGQSGESFFGVGATFVGGENLKITSNGGKGGPGQDGGDGVSGDPGRDAHTPYNSDPPCDNGCVRGFKCEGIRNKSGGGLVILTVIHREWSCTEKPFMIYGLPCSRGGNGGNGGKAGKGGDPGNVTVIELSQPSKITKFTSTGVEGKMGTGGSGGSGGTNGNDVYAKWSHCEPSWLGYVLGGLRAYSKWEWERTVTNDGVCPTGTNGTKGENGSPQNPLPANGIRDFSNLINEYKNYVRLNLNNRFKRYYLLQFVDKLNGNSDVRNLYDTLGLIAEFQGLESQFHKLSDQMDFCPFYSSLLERISEFAKSHKDGPNFDENKKVLNYLYTAALGRMYDLKEISESELIIDIYHYLNLVKENIKTLKDLQIMNIKVDAINKYKEYYKKGIDKKIEEAESFIKKMNREIEKASLKIEDQVYILIEETFLLQKQAEKERKELKEKREKLENALEIKGLFRCFQIIGGIVSFLSPIGAIVGTVIETASTVGESLALGNQQQTLNLSPDIVSAIKFTGDQIKALRNQKVAYLNKLLNNVSEEIKKNPEKLNDMTRKITDIEDKLKKATEDKIDFKQVKLLESELKRELRRKSEDLKIHSGDKKSVDALKIIGKLSQIVEFGSLLLHLYDKMKGDQEKIDVITDAVEKIDNKIKKLREYEDIIYDTIAPMLQEMEDHMKDISDKLGSKSQVSLDVTKWQVQSTLKDMKLLMQQLTERFVVKDELSRSIEKLDEVMTTTINLYDRIQSYQNQQNLANYIADISSVAASSIAIKDQQLVNAVNRLEFVIRANIVLKQYKTAIDALTQWAFPFPDRYIEKSMLPSQLELNTNIQDLVQEAMRRIERIKQKLDLYKTTVREGNASLMKGYFNGQSRSSKPFFVWENKEYGGLISDLLLGKEVVFKADIKKSPPLKDAIKFSEIDFDFKTINESAQSLLSETLKGFDIRAIHLGNSYYRYANKIFLITSDSVTIYYSFEKNEDGIRLRSNGVYNQLESGDLLMSPYTLWEIKLINATDQYSYPDLESYKNGIDLELTGFGSYVDMNPMKLTAYKSTIVHDSTNRYVLESNATDDTECMRPKYRLVRSPNEYFGNGDYTTNGAACCMPSPINFLCNFLKTYFVSNAMISIKQLFIRKQRWTITDPAVISNPSSTAEKAKSATDHLKCNGEKIERTSENIFSGDFYDGSSLLLNDYRDNGKNQFIQAPDLNCSLLLADLVTRTITGNRYKSAIDNCLFSPRKVVFEKISNGAVRNEIGIKRQLQRHLSEKEDARTNSWLTKLNGYAKKMLQLLGIMGNDETEEYVQDIRNLFT